MGEYVKITPPDRVVITPAGNQCKGISSNLSQALSCTISDTSVYVRLNPKDVTTQTTWSSGDEVQF